MRGQGGVVVYPPMPPGPPGTPGGQQLQEASQRQAQAAMVQRPAAQAVPDAAAVRAAEERAKEAAAERVRAAQAAAALRAEEARQEREHAKLVDAHELETNWAATQAHLERLQVRINRMPENGSAHPAIAWIAIPVMFFAILMALVAAAPFGATNEPSPLAYVYGIIAVLLCWGAWALVRRARRAIRARHVEELRTLARSRDRAAARPGAGAATAARSTARFARLGRGARRLVWTRTQHHRLSGPRGAAGL
jgi:hypothetical protein